MALRRQNLSPTANLLRNSRLFSLPKPLPRPPVAEVHGAGTKKASDTATLPFPTHQAITTTPQSLARGDWGLKRPLPSRSRILQTSDPVVKVKQLDTIEHITDYDSAADHVRTRQKWEELGIPMMKGMAAMRNEVSGVLPGGVFERRSDITSYEQDEGLDDAGKILEAIKQSLVENHKVYEQEKRSLAARHRRHLMALEKTGVNLGNMYKPDLGDLYKPFREVADVPYIPFSVLQSDAARHNSRRWKHEGPWLPGMSANEFTRFMEQQLSSRKKEFRQYLHQYARNEIYLARQVAWKKAQVLPEDPVEAEEHLRKQEDMQYMAQLAREWSNISNEDIDAVIKSLRSEAAANPLQSPLVQRLIVPFLRIPTIKVKTSNYRQGLGANDAIQLRFDDDSTPLSTHPSAGLGYLCTNSYMSNHPILGPQGERAPVKARVLQPRSVSGTNYARVGVAGFVTDDEYRGIGEYRNVGRDATSEIDIHTEGGAKLNVLPRFGSVTSDGRIHIKLSRSTGMEVQVANGELEDLPPVRSTMDPSPLSDLRSLGNSGTELDQHTAQANAFMDLIQKMPARPNKERRPEKDGSFVEPDETQNLGERRPGLEAAVRGRSSRR